MTHPVVSAFHRMKSLEKMSESENMITASRALYDLNELDRFIAQTMAADPIPEFFVGFYQLHFDRVFSIRVWDNTSDEPCHVYMRQIWPCTRTKKFVGREGL